jgi:lysophospholipase L1-like esterase
MGGPPCLHESKGAMTRAALLACLLGWAWWGAALAGVPLAHPGTTPGTTPVGHWATYLARFDADDQAHPKPAGGVVFVGSSSIYFWDGLASQFNGPSVVIGRGLPGACIDEVTRHLDRLVVRYRPRQVLVYAGDNDIAEGRSPQAVRLSFLALVGALHTALPDARIGFIAIKPSPRRSSVIAQVRQADALIRADADGAPGFDYIDVFSPMLNADGSVRTELFRHDGLHLNPAGYKLWRDVIARWIH